MKHLKRTGRKWKRSVTNSLRVLKLTSKLYAKKSRSIPIEDPRVSFIDDIKDYFVNGNEFSVSGYAVL